MSDCRKELLLAALQRAGKARTSAELLDDATGLALAEGWEPAQTAKLTRKGVAKHLQHMEKAGLVRSEGTAFDNDAGRMTPTFVPVAGFDPRAQVPSAPTAVESITPARPADYENLNRTQLITLLDVQDDMLAEFARHLQEQERFFIKLGAIREKARARLLAVGLGAA